MPPPQGVVWEPSMGRMPTQLASLQRLRASWSPFPSPRGSMQLLHPQSTATEFHLNARGSDDLDVAHRLPLFSLLCLLDSTTPTGFYICWTPSTLPMGHAACCNCFCLAPTQAIPDSACFAINHAFWMTPSPRNTYHHHQGLCLLPRLTTLTNVITWR